MTMKKISGVLVLLLSTIVLVTACGDKKTKTESTDKTAKSKSSQVSKSASESTKTSNSDTTPSSATKQEEAQSHNDAEESQWSKASSEAAKVMTVTEGREALREVGIDDSNLSNADINKYILEAQAAGVTLGNYMKSQGF
ncbi:MAG: hypothetical protein L0F95_08955 [Lactococcus sp.]|nr:hypothetical protein [Lactococcus sp.]MDN5404302.1 hypothetical protein [Lactococcus sp.]MDN5410576.1 hypothetical protein [Lactococcus sp.]MDN5412516.1 hypothetical protein [Lactococcus sp.]MDN5437063.1 hypothetical protein [Lactococcus sp.]MDN5462281.1 hypothetical protein [Lactococcus sp.]